METLQIKAKLHLFIDYANAVEIQQVYKMLFPKMDVKNESINIEQYNAEIEASELEYEEGNYITHEEFKKEIKQW